MIDYGNTVDTVWEKGLWDLNDMTPELATIPVHQSVVLPLGCLCARVISLNEIDVQSTPATVQSFARRHLYPYWCLSLYFVGQVAWYLKFVVYVSFLVSLSVQTWNIFEKIGGVTPVVFSFVGFHNFSAKSSNCWLYFPFFCQLQVTIGNLSLSIIR
jgi:hypothetical protein